MKITTKNLRDFGLIWSLIFTILGIYPLVQHSFKLEFLNFWATGLALIFLLITILKPKFLSKFYEIWIKFGEFMGHITSTIILAILFFGVFTPISLFFKIIRRDPLNRKIDKKAKTYWIKRELQPQSMKYQF